MSREPRIRAVAVVVPARDEERLIGACLRAASLASRHPGLGGLPVAVVVAADSCRDGTAALARAHGAEVLPVRAGAAGAGRALGTAHALDLLRTGRPGLSDPPGLSAEEVWLAHTDADSQVPPCWLARQLRHAERGFDAVVGTVRVDDWSQHAPGLEQRFRSQYAAHRGLRRDHPHVHGANLGVRAAAYLAVGGFPPLATGEDVALVAALQSGGHRLVRTDACPVRTSARRDPRAPGGFSDFLLALETA